MSDSIGKKRSLTDPCRYTGSPIWYTSPEERAYIEECKKKLPRLDYVVKVGPTGHPSDYRQMKEVGWTYDQTGRVFISTPTHYLFQRYTQGDVLMSKTKDGTTGWISAPSRLIASEFAKLQ